MKLTIKRDDKALILRETWFSGEGDGFRFECDRSISSAHLVVTIEVDGDRQQHIVDIAGLAASMAEAAQESTAGEVVADGLEVDFEVSAKKKDSGPRFHGEKLDEAIARARKIGGVVIRSDPDQNSGDAYERAASPGLWSDENRHGPRSWETVVWPVEVEVSGE